MRKRVGLERRKRERRLSALGRFPLRVPLRSLRESIPRCWMPDAGFWIVTWALPYPFPEIFEGPVSARGLRRGGGPASRRGRQECPPSVFKSVLIRAIRGSSAPYSGWSHLAKPAFLKIGSSAVSICRRKAFLILSRISR